MNTKFLSSILIRLLVIVTVVIPLALGAISPVKASSLSVIGWGCNNCIMTSIPPGLTDAVAVAAGSTHSLALKSDGTVVGWGSNSSGQISIPTDLTGVVAIDAGEYYSLALKADGTVVGWGNNSRGEINIPVGLTGVVAISAGGSHSLALKNDGTVVAWGGNWNGQTNVPAGLTDVVAVAAGYLYSLALKSDGTVVAWGSNIGGERNVPADLAGVVAIAAGVSHGLALKSDGTVIGWGNNNFEQISIPADLTGVVAISANGYRSNALKNDGTVVGWGVTLSGEPDVPPGLMDVAAIDTGPGFSLAIGRMNNPPIANTGGPYLGAVNTSISFDGSLSSDLEGSTLTYDWDFGDGARGTGATPTHSYSAAGVYNACLTVNDGERNSSLACTLAVIYDPSAGFVIGGGWIDSPAGAYKADGSLSGKANFGFQSKYQKGATLPEGNTSFKFQTGDFSFQSEAYEWLVVNQAGTNAQFKGMGTVNGELAPNGNAYKFMLWAGDGATDTFRIRIWWEDASGVTVDVYDNGVDQAIGAGNIVVHTSK